jgi:hypothetical protein
MNPRDIVDHIRSGRPTKLVQDSNLECLELRMESGFTDDAGVALAEALAVNKTLLAIKLADIVRADHRVHNKDALGAQAYKAFSAMLRANTSLILKLPWLDTAGHGWWGSKGYRVSQADGY